MNLTHEEMIIKKAMLEMLKKFNNQLNKAQMESEAKLEGWATFLAFEKKLTVKQVGYALSKLMDESVKFMPSAYEIAAVIKHKNISSEDAGNLIADEIVTKALEFGSYRLGEALKAMSDDAQLVLGCSTRLLREICESNRDELPIIKSQIRKLAVARIEKNKIQTHNNTLQVLTGGTAPILRDLSTL